MDLSYLLPIYRLCREIVNHEVHSSEWNTCIANLSREMLKLRRFCRGNFQTCKDLYEAVNEELTQDLKMMMAEAPPTKQLHLTLEEHQWKKDVKAQKYLYGWVVTFGERVFCRVLLLPSKNEPALMWLDCLAMTAKNQEPKSRELNKAIHEVYVAVTTLKRFPQLKFWYTEQYKKLYNDVLDSMWDWLYVPEKYKKDVNGKKKGQDKKTGLEIWNPEKGSFLALFNTIFKQRLSKRYGEARAENERDKEIFSNSREILITDSEPDEESSIWWEIAIISILEIIQYLKEDIELKEGLKELSDWLQSKHMRDHPTASLLTMLQIFLQSDLKTADARWRFVGESLGVDKDAARQFCIKRLRHEEFKRFFTE
jgi:hypothetical protein